MVMSSRPSEVVGGQINNHAAVAAGIARVGKCEVGDDLFGAVEHQPNNGGTTAGSESEKHHLM